MIAEFRIFTSCLVLSIFVLSSLVHAEENLDAPIAAFEEGKTAFAEKRYVEAADAFRKAYEQKPSWKLLYNIGQAEAAGKRYGLALEAFERYLAEGGDDIDIARQKAVQDEVNRLRGMVGYVEVMASKGTVVLVDDINRGTAPILGELPVAASVVHTLKGLVNGVCG